ncbi:MAG: hypothetical protein K9L17_14380 [Clostridiales bacterium]|nr:hypothetical protein [Clostridiales bacterium]
MKRLSLLIILSALFLVIACNAYHGTTKKDASKKKQNIYKDIDLVKEDVSKSYNINSIMRSNLSFATSSKYIYPKFMKEKALLSDTHCESFYHDVRDNYRAEVEKSLSSKSKFFTIYKKALSSYLQNELQTIKISNLSVQERKLYNANKLINISNSTKDLVFNPKVTFDMYNFILKLSYKKETPMKDDESTIYYGNEYIKFDFSNHNLILTRISTSDLDILNLDELKELSIHDLSKLDEFYKHYQKAYQNSFSGLRNKYKKLIQNAEDQMNVMNLEDKSLKCLLVSKMLQAFTPTKDLSLKAINISSYKSTQYLTLKANTSMY